MTLKPISANPVNSSYDVVIIGGAMMGSSAAWFLSDNEDFNGSVLVVERDHSYQWCSTAHTNSCIRQQFSNRINIKISQFGVAFLKSFRDRLGGDPRIPDIALQSYGYMFFAGNPGHAEILRENQLLQKSYGAGTRILCKDEIAAQFPFYNLDGILLGSHNPTDEGYFDGGTMFDWWRRKARENGIEYISNEVVKITRAGNRIESVALKSGEIIRAGKIINAAGPRGALTAKMAGLHLPVEPRKRYTFIFDAETPLDQELPLTIDPSGVHVRTDGRRYLAGCPPDDDPAVDFNDFDIDYSIWEKKVWPALANRIPLFESIRLVNAWAGHYAYNTLDQNAVMGAHPEVTNFIFVNGFSGHGFQQSAAMGRGVSELVAYDAFRTLDLSELGYERILENNPFTEKAVI